MMAVQCHRNCWSRYLLNSQILHKSTELLVRATLWVHSPNSMGRPAGRAL